MQRVELSVDQRLSLAYQGQQNILEAVKLAESGDDPYIYNRLSLFLQSSGLGFPPKLQLVQPKSEFWRETLWDRVIPGIPSYILPKVKDVGDVLKQADKALATVNQLDPNSMDYLFLIIEAEANLTNVVGSAVDQGDLGSAGLAIAILRKISEKGGNTDLLPEPLSYLGVAQMKLGLSPAEIEQLQADVILGIVSAGDEAARQAVSYFGLDKKLTAEDESGIR